VIGFGGRSIDELSVGYECDVDRTTGASTLRIPVPLPPGRNGFGPSFALSYTSGSGNSPFGAGWALSGLPTIGIDTREHVPRWDGSDRYQLSGDELVPWLEFDGAKLRRTAFHRSLIRSDERLDYPRVDRIFAGEERALDPWAKPLAAARRVAAALAAAREARGALAVESSEPEFGFSREGHVETLLPSEQTESHRLIEFLMIAANEAVASLLEARRLPALFRVHEPPEAPRVERLAAQLESLDVPTPPLPEHLTREQAGAVVSEAARLVDREVRRRGHGRAAFTSLVLRSLKQAHYSPRNLGHYGLRSPRYCHFTSPIRRYPDLICHRALLSAIGAGEATVRASDLAAAGEWCSARERDAMVIERSADNVARAFLLERRLFEERAFGREFAGEVAGVIAAGAFVSFDGHEGMLPVRRLGDWYDLNELETMLVGASGKRIRLGDAVRVQVEKVEAVRGRVDLAPVEV